MCADQMMKGGEMYCKPCDVGSFDWDAFKCSASLASEGRAFNSYCQSNLLPPDGCQCDDVFEDSDLMGYVKADQVYFGRGSVRIRVSHRVLIQTSHFMNSSLLFLDPTFLELQLHSCLGGINRCPSNLLSTTRLGCYQRRVRMGCR
jgi:hypothetical protein